MSLAWAYRFFVACIVSGVITLVLGLAVFLNWGYQSFTGDDSGVLSVFARSSEATALASEESRQQIGSGVADEFKERLDRAEDSESVLSVLREFAGLHGLSIETQIAQKYQQNVRGEETAESDADGLRIFAQVFVDEISKYPKNTLADNGVKKFLLLSNPEVRDERGEYHFGGLAIAEDNQIVLDYTDGQFEVGGETKYVDYPLSSRCESSDVNIRKGIHHEIWHLFDEEALGYRDAGWSELNDSGFRYSEPDTFAGFDVDYHNCRVVKGSDFTTPYAQIDALEDRADTYAYLMTTELYIPNRKFLEAENGQLRRKIAFIKKQLQAIDERMDERFFDNLHK